jgi:hypothetical protein
VAWDKATVIVLDGSSAVDFPWTGNQPSDSNPPTGMQVAMCVSWRTGFAGRSKRGRSFIGPMSNSAIDGSKPDMLNTAYVTTYGASSNAMIGNFVTDGFELVVASYTLGTAESVQQAIVNPHLCTMRKRVNGR